MLNQAEVQRTEIKKLDEVRSYEDLVYRQLSLITFIGSQDTTNAGRVYLDDIKGQTHEVVRYNYEVAYVHAVEVLRDLVYERLENKVKTEADKIKIQNKEDREHARELFQLILRHLHKSGIFGRASLMVVWDFEVEREKTKRWLKENAPTFTD